MNKNHILGIILLVLFDKKDVGEKSNRLKVTYSQLFEFHFSVVNLVHFIVQILKNANSEADSK